MALVVGIDFTHSNKPFKQPDSLHYVDGPSTSFYEVALR
jgi:hypothetical protein